MTTILDYLYLGLRASTSATFISTHTVTDVLSIGSSPLVILPGVAYHRLSLTDDIDASLDRVISPANDFITAVADDQPRRRILVHCSAAVSRSPTVVACLLDLQAQHVLARSTGPHYYSAASGLPEYRVFGTT
ncbi:hypothetical protein FB45DRAFT_134359 [Roridomyces roridus]|uniref:Tyrosine specific protein phosphatases domain-containing protein n=1 Tax=Roridomyces roridus TaxID=1738132 RepID=A0AAD7FFF5_9AGAR|nr:hypothetical protein FB45DRAFT_134359 [Roridomyces roridus]